MCYKESGKLNEENFIVETKRQYFVYFYGKYLEYAWLSTRSLINYAGLNNFIVNAESAVQQLELANRYQLKVSMKKRIQWFRNFIVFFQRNFYCIFQG